MNIAVTEQLTQFILRAFDPRYAAVIAQWVESQEELRWLAPSTKGPLTALKVSAWKRAGRRAFMLTADDAPEPVGYGELSPMRADPTHFWIGHVIVRPDQRGRGAGRALVRALLDQSFRQLFAKRVSLVVFPDNKAAIDCYRRVGFRIVAEEFHRFGGRGPAHRLLRLEVVAARAGRDRRSGILPT